MTTQKKLTQAELYGELLTSQQYYRREVLSNEPPGDEQITTWTQLARASNPEAREGLLGALLSYVLYWARCYALTYSWLSGCICEEELVGVGNLTLVELFSQGLSKENPYGYLATCVRYEMYKFCKQFEGVQEISLDAPLSDDASFSLADLLAAPREVAESTAEERQAAYRAMYQAIGQLKRRERTVIVYEYGFPDCATLEETADSERVIWREEKIERLRATKCRALSKLFSWLVSSYPQYGGRVREEMNEAKTDPPAISPEQYQRLQQAIETLETSGKPITIRTLSQLAHVSQNQTCFFLRRWRAQRGLHQSREQRLEAAYHALQTEHGTVNVTALMSRAQVAFQVASSYLYSRDGTVSTQHSEVPHEQRLALAYAQLLLRGEPISAKKLAEEAHVSWYRASDYLEQLHPEKAEELAPRERVEQAYQQMCAQGARITGETLARTASVCSKLAYSYLHQVKTVLA